MNKEKITYWIVKELFSVFELFWYFCFFMLTAAGLLPAYSWMLQHGILHSIVTLETQRKGVADKPF